MAGYRTGHFLVHQSRPALVRLGMAVGSRFAWLYQHGGLATVVAVNIMILCLTFALLFRLVRRHCENPFVAIAVTFLACAASAIHWLARPHLVTMLFTVILLMVLDRDREGHTRWLWALPLFFVLWTNLHGGFLAGLIVLAGYAAGELATRAVHGDSGERRAALRIRRRAMARYRCFARSQHRESLHLSSARSHLQVLLRAVSRSEYHPSFNPSASTPRPRCIWRSLLLLGAFAAAWFVIKRRDFVPLVLIAGWAHLALFAARNIPLFAIVAAPFVAQALYEMLCGLEHAQVAAWIGRATAGFRTAAAEFARNRPALEAARRQRGRRVVIALLIANPNASGKLKPEYDPQRYPAKALSVLRADPGLENLHRRRVG